MIRGSEGNPNYSPPYGFRYDGQYTVERYWSERGRSGFRVLRFKLIRLEAVLSVWEDGGRRVGEMAPRASSTVQRIIRSTAVTQRVKELHRHRCQICGIRLATPAGPYAEGAHIRPLGRPHDGPDEVGNVLCLCPNHHTLFDTGAIVIDDGLEVLDTVMGTSIGRLREAPGHGVDREQLAYHRALYPRDIVHDR